MAKRYAISTMTGSGTSNDPYMPVLSTLDVNGVSVTIAPPAQRASKAWVLCAVAGTDAQLQAAGTNPNVTILPVGPDQLDTAWTSIGGNNVRNQFANNIRQRTGINVTRDDPRTLRQIITAIGQDLDPTFNPANLDVYEGPGELRTRGI